MSNLQYRLYHLTAGIAALVEKANSCHNKSDGRFCSTQSGTSFPDNIETRAQAEQYIKTIGFAEEVTLGDIEDWRAVTLARTAHGLRKDFPNTPSVRALRVESLGDNDKLEPNWGLHTVFGEILLDTSLFKTGSHGSAKQTLDHEFAHHLDQVMSHRNDFLVGGPKNPHREIVKTAFEGNWKLNNYAKTSSSEMVAEAFVNFRTGGDRLVGDLAPLKTVFNDWKKGKEWNGKKFVVRGK